MSDGTTIYFACALGVAISVLLPVMRAALPKPAQGEGAGVSGWFPRFWAAVWPYLVLAVFSLAVGAVIMAAMDLNEWKAALLAGYASDSTLQRLKG